MDIQGYAVTVVFELVPGREALFMTQVVANASRSLEVEEGCRVFDVCASEGNSEVFLYEVYDSRAAFDAHLASEHFLQFDAASRSWVRSKTVRTYNLLGEPAK